MKGQSLIEAVIAIAVIALLISGISVTVASSLNNADYGKKQALATQYAQEGIEILQKIRNNNYAAFQGYSGTYCLGKDETTITTPGICTANVDEFIRSVTIAQNACAANVARATVSVSWTDGKCSGGAYCHKSSLISCLSITNPIQAP